MKIKLSILSILLMFAFANLNAQKFGYLNSSQLIMMHPDVKAADQKLVNYQNELIAKGEAMAKKLETNYNAYVAEANTGTLSKIKMQEKETALTQEQEAIRQYEIEMQQLVLTKRETLYKPILDNIQQAVETVGKENGYQMIFDTSTGGLLHANDTDNILDKVKAKLNL